MFVDDVLRASTPIQLQDLNQNDDSFPFIISANNSEILNECSLNKWKVSIDDGRRSSLEISFISTNKDEETLYRIDMNRNYSLELSLSSSASTTYKEVPEAMTMIEVKKDDDDDTKDPVTITEVENEDNTNHFEINVLECSSDESSEYKNISHIEEISVIGDSSEIEIDVDDYENYDYDFDFEDFIKLKNEPDESEKYSLESLIAELPVDHPLLNTKFKPVNRDVNAEIKQIAVTKNFQNQIAYLSEIFDPAHFYFQPLTDELSHGELSYYNFKTSIKRQYSELEEDDLIITRKNLKIGLVVAAYFETFKRWYRARITKICNKRFSIIGMFFIDYGTYAELPIRCLKYLFSEFLDYPQFCLRGRLYGIKPSKGKRSFDVRKSEKFIMAVSSEQFYLSLVRYDENEDVYEMEVVRRSDNLDMRKFVLNKKIGSEIQSHEYDKETCIGTPCYLIPSFYMLEHGFPTFSELEDWQSQEINFNLLIETDFFHSLRIDGEVEEKGELHVILNHEDFRMQKRYFYHFD